MATFDASYVYRIKDYYSATLKRITATTGKFENKVRKARRSLSKMGSQTEKTKKRMDDMKASLGALAGTAGLGMAIKGMIDTASAFESAMNSVEAKTQAGSRQMKMLRSQARMLGETTQFSATQAAEGMEIFATAGLKTNDILKLMPGLLNLAASGQLDLASAAGIATGTLAQFGLDLSEVNRVNDVLATAATNSKTNILEMSEALKNSGSFAKLAGLSLEDTTSALMVMADANVRGGEAGTQLMNVLRELSGGGPKVRKLFRSLGADMSQFIDKSTGEIKDLRGIIELFGKTSDKSAFGLKRFTDAFDVRAAKGLAVLAKAGTKSFDKMKGSVDGAAGSSEKMAEILMKGLPGAQKKLKSATESLSLSFTATFLPALSDTAEMLASFFGNLARNHPVLLKITAAMAGFALTLGLVGTAVLVVGPVIAAITLPIVAITAAVAGAVAGLVMLARWLKKSGKWAEFAKWIEQAWLAMKKFVSELRIFQFLSDFFGVLIFVLKKLGDILYELFGEVLEGFIDGILAGFKALMRVVKWIVKLVDGLFGVFVDILSLDFGKAWDTMKQTFSDAIDGMLQMLADLKDYFFSIFTGDEEIGFDVSEIEKQYAAMMKGPPAAKVVAPGEGAQAREMAQMKATQELAVSGGISVRAEKGTEVTDANVYAGRNGQNLATSGVTGSW